MYLVDLGVLVFFAFEKLGDLLGSEADAHVVAKVEYIQADVFFRFFKFWQFHSYYIITADYTDCTPLEIFLYFPEYFYPVWNF